MKLSEVLRNWVLSEDVGRVLTMWADEIIDNYRDSDISREQDGDIDMTDGMPTAAIFLKAAGRDGLQATKGYTKDQLLRYAADAEMLNAPLAADWFRWAASRAASIEQPVVENEVLKFPDRIKPMIMQAREDIFEQYMDISDALDSLHDVLEKSFHVHGSASAEEVNEITKLTEQTNESIKMLIVYLDKFLKKL